MTSNQPYLLRAFYEWIVDNNLTPYLVVDVNVPGIQVPMEHAKDGQIVLNVSPSACGKLQMGNIDVSFEARFGGMAKVINVPCKAVLAIYAKENGAGTVFSAEEEFTEEFSEPTAVEPSAEPTAPKTKSKKGRPTLTVVK
jgi:stringent starvation protein B